MGIDWDYELWRCAHGPWPGQYPPTVAKDEPMGIDFSGMAFPKGKPRVEIKREKRLEAESQEDAARRMVRARDGRRCAVPGCREDGVHLHHIIYRSKSKKHQWDPARLCYLCVSHHAWEHAGKITISGNANEELIVTGERQYLKFKL